MTPFQAQMPIKRGNAKNAFRALAVGLGLVIAFGTFNEEAIAAEVGPAVPAKPMQVFRPLNVPTGTNRVETLPGVTRMPNEKAVAIAPAERGHVDAYFASSRGTLFVLNPVRFSQGIKSGKFAVQWELGTSSANIVGEGTRPRPVRVIAGLADLPADTVPKVGDVKFVSLAEKKSTQENIGQCFNYDTPVSTRKSFRYVSRSYTTLTGDGRESGTETFSVITRDYEYKLKDCSAEFENSSDYRSTWVLDAGAWPNP